MFVNNEELETLREAIVPLDTETVREAYRLRQIPNGDKVKDIDKRYRWDLLYAARQLEIVYGIYDRGGHNAHVDTALRRIVEPL